jgi:hypothetical protein
MVNNKRKTLNQKGDGPNPRRRRREEDQISFDEAVSLVNRETE